MHPFIKYNLISREQFKYAQRIQNQRGGKLGEILLDLGYVNERKVVQYCEKIIGR